MIIKAPSISEEEYLIQELPLSSDWFVASHVTTDTLIVVLFSISLLAKPSDFDSVLLILLVTTTFEPIGTVPTTPEASGYRLPPKVDPIIFNLLRDRSTFVIKARSCT